MRHLKDEVESIKANVECGLQLAGQDIEPQVGDTIVCYTLKKEKQTIDWNPGFWTKSLEASKLQLTSCENKE